LRLRIWIFGKVICFPISIHRLAGLIIPAPSLATYLARRRFCGPWGIETTFTREGRAGSRMIRIRATRENIVRAAPSAASATDLHRDPPVTSATTAVALIWSAGTQSSKSLHPPTMLTVLTQMPLFGWGNSEWTYGHPDGPSRRPFGISQVVPDRGARSYLGVVVARPGRPSHMSISMIWVSL
jgi:hypothetical protein